MRWVVLLCQKHPAMMFCLTRGSKSTVPTDHGTIKSPKLSPKKPFLSLSWLSQVFVRVKESWLNTLVPTTKQRPPQYPPPHWPSTKYQQQKLPNLELVSPWVLKLFVFPRDRHDIFH
jgi:hypothetical protein